MQRVQTRVQRLVAFARCGGGEMRAADHARARKAWLEPRLARTSVISGAHLAAAAAGEGHEVLHACLEALFSANADWPPVLGRLDNVGHCSGWDSLAGVVAVAKLS